MIEPMTSAPLKTSGLFIPANESQNRNQSFERTNSINQFKINQTINQFSPVPDGGGSLGRRAPALAGHPFALNNNLNRSSSSTIGGQVNNIEITIWHVTRQVST